MEIVIEIHILIIIHQIIIQDIPQLEYIDIYNKMERYYLTNMLTNIMGMILLVIFMLWKINKVMAISVVDFLLKKVYYLYYCRCSLK